MQKQCQGLEFKSTKSNEFKVKVSIAISAFLYCIMYFKKLKFKVPDLDLCRNYEHLEFNIKKCNTFLYEWCTGNRKKNIYIKTVQTKNNIFIT